MSPTSIGGGANIITGEGLISPTSLKGREEDLPTANLEQWHYKGKGAVLLEASAENEIEVLKNIIDASHNIVFFGGAGMSTESGIPDFRSAKGIITSICIGRSHRRRWSPIVFL